MEKNSRKNEALEYHSKGRPGKIEVVPTKDTKTQRDLSLAYSPGVAEPCLEIAANPDDVYNISILFRDSFDYIIRKKYVIQTKFNLNEHEPIFFLWGFINCLFNYEPSINNYYKLFCLNNPSFSVLIAVVIW